MRRATKSWVIAAVVLTAALLLDGWLALLPVPVFYGRAALIIGLASVLSWYRPKFATTGTTAVVERTTTPAANDDLIREIALAVEHIRSIRVLLHVSQAHEQPVPPAVSRNLALVAKHLEKAMTCENATPAGICAVQESRKEHLQCTDA
jgi:hypothetical protein